MLTTELSKRRERPIIMTTGVREDSDGKTGPGCLRLGSVCLCIC